MKTGKSAGIAISPHPPARAASNQACHPTNQPRPSWQAAPEFDVATSHANPASCGPWSSGKMVRNAMSPVAGSRLAAYVEYSRAIKGSFRSAVYARLRFSRDTAKYESRFMLVAISGRLLIVDWLYNIAPG